MNLIKIKIICFAVFCFFIVGCVTNRSATNLSDQANKERLLKKKAGDKAKSSQATADQASEGERQAGLLDERPDLDMLFKKHSSFEEALGGVDGRTVTAICSGARESGSLAEAILAVAIIKTVLFPSGGGLMAHPFKSRMGFEEKDIHPAAFSDNKGNLAVTSLETLSKNWNLDFPLALEKNRFLQSHEIYRATLRALAKGYNSDDFKRNIVSSMKVEATLWLALASAIGIIDAKLLTGAALAEAEGNFADFGAVLPKESGVPGGQGEAGGTGVAVASRIAEGGTDLPVPANPSEAQQAGQKGEGTIVDAEPSTGAISEAQKLAEGGKYKDATIKLRQIAPQSSLYPAAQEKLKSYSNVAVQDLRQKAAQAFQDSLSASDARSRASYLERAKGYLEEAINAFPEAGQLATVQENLSIISRNLEQLPPSK